MTSRKLWTGYSEIYQVKYPKYSLWPARQNSRVDLPEYMQKQENCYILCVMAASFIADMSPPGATLELILKEDWRKAVKKPQFWKLWIVFNVMHSTYWKRHESTFGLLEIFLCLNRGKEVNLSQEKNKWLTLARTTRHFAGNERATQSH